ncbi:MAG: Sulfate-transporting ATPase [candidate division TM6 bacterium GW2011_GWE2_31_21]|nr:MAG: Sulfate-transporting ATPase [candidate division TM6 bacterium GW2011_GWE2_31_21]KKP52923.1 MAG: Sulfate-transporting ATPase [candidate division TM6 bacterium GW2011_GWF2_33_332]
MPYLSIENVKQSYGKKNILRGVSFEANLGQIVALLGPNGAGKTTLLKSVIGILPVQNYDEASKTNGLFLKNQLINSWSISKRVASGLVYLPQNSSLFEDLSVLDNLKIVYQYHPFWKNKDTNSKKVFNEEMNKWIAKSNLSSVLSLKAGQLSGGQKRKLEVIRSLLMHPDVIMFDEPFAGVDPKSIYELKTIFVDLAKSGISILISDHNVDQLLSIANKIYVIIDGMVVVSGGIKEIMDNPYTQEMYFGKQFHTEMSEKFLG